MKYILSGAKPIYSFGRISVFTKPGGYRQAIRDFKAVHPENIEVVHDIHGIVSSKNLDSRLNRVRRVYFEYSRLSLSRSPKDYLKYSEISVSRHIRFAELRKKDKSNNHISQMNM